MHWANITNKNCTGPFFIGLSLFSSLLPSSLHPHTKCELTKNPTIFNIILWVAGTNDSLTKRLMFQVLFFFSWFLAKYFAKILSIFFLFLYKQWMKTLHFYFFKVIKKKFEMIFAKDFARNYEEKKYLEHQTLGQWDDHPSDPAYYIEDCRINL